METQRKSFFCDSCGKQIEFYRKGPAADTFRKWITISYWEGMGAVAHYSFCSLDCLKTWLDKQLPQVPEVFLKSFDHEP